MVPGTAKAEEYRYEKDFMPLNWSAGITTESEDMVVVCGCSGVLVFGPDGEVHGW